MKILILHIKDLSHDFSIFRETAKSFPNTYETHEAFLKEDAKKIGSTPTHRFYFDKNQLKKPNVITTVKQYLQREKFNVVIAHRYRAINILAQAAKDLPILKIGVFHGLNNISFFKRRFLHTHTQDFHFVCVSQAVKNYIVANKLPKERCYVIYNAVNIKAMRAKQFSRLQAREKLKLDASDFVYGMVGRMSTQKGYEYLIPAFHQFCVTHPQTKLCIVGDGRKSIQHKIEKYIQKHNLQNNIFLKGYISNAYRYMRAFDTLILPSTSEGFGLVLLEAMCAHTPIIASNAGGIPEVLESNVSIFEKKSTRALYDAMVKNFAMHPNNPAVQDIHLQKFDIQKHYENYNSLVNSLFKNQ
ncbi:glycosyltransferase [Candidatus Uabimicrobium amorphum]|uniref:Glycosyl transferase n=1 Tax=Uabimicrobium amorphum TaxID=2596890 RepID=A0A5S9ITX0_UABAM|nr:glycosyltransferase [Candidatus Uabimicrobium amorphum]BBM87501.1 glycosyl transferase [Candidatus Uabimicrobium amorphum]